MSSTIQESSKNFSTENAFYNQAMTFNREITIAVIKNFAKNLKENNHNPKLKILEALGASGLRSVRFAKELDEEFIEKIICNDISSHSFKTIKNNIDSHNVSHLVEANLANAVNLMQENCIRYEDKKFSSIKNYKRHERESSQSNATVTSSLGFDVIDLDPFGSVVPFLDSAVQAVRDGGLLCLTCTDMAVLSGSQLQACYSYYGTWPVRTGQRKTCHEQALRTLLHSVESTASKYGRAVKPLISISVDYYIRVFVKIIINKNEQNKSCCKNGLLAVCKGCGNFKTKPFARETKPFARLGCDRTKIVSNDFDVLEGKCQICDGNFTVGGPYYLSDIQDKSFIVSLLNSMASSKYQTQERILSFLTCLNLELDLPFHCSIPQLNQSLKVACTVSPSKLRKIVLASNQKISRVHTTSHGFKTSLNYQNLVNIFIALDLQLGLERMILKPAKKSKTCDQTLQTRKRVLEKFWWKDELDEILKQVEEIDFFRQNVDEKEFLKNKLLKLDVDNGSDGNNVVNDKKFKILPIFTTTTRSTTFQNLLDQITVFKQKVSSKINQLIPNNYEDFIDIDDNILRNCIVWKDFGHAPGALPKKRAAESVEEKSRKNQGKYVKKRKSENDASLT